MTIRFDTDRMRIDAALKGFNGAALARRARVSDMTVSRFLRGESRSPKVAKKLATALGYTVRRYLVTDESDVARQAS